MKKKYKHQKKIVRLPIIRLVIIALSITAGIIALQINLSNRTRAQTGGFHLTEELYGSNTADGINFNVHVIFNFDGCDGDIMLYEGDKHIAGPNGWKGPVNFPYNETWTASPKFIPNDGESHTISYRGSVNRCPRSPDTLWEEVSCGITYDASGYPQVAPSDRCTIKNLAEIQPVPFTAPKPIVPTSVPIPTDPPAAKVNIPIQPNPTKIVILPTDTPTPQATQIISTPTVTPATSTDQTVIKFMGIKLGRLSTSQPLDFIRIIIDVIKSLGR